MSAEIVQQDAAARGAYALLGLLAAGSVALGVWFAFVLARSEDALWRAQLAAQQAGRTLDVQGCVDHVMAWRAGCGALSTLCDQTVDPMIETCLRGQDRKPWCAGVVEWTGTTGFEYAQCDRMEVQAIKPAKGFWDRMLFGGGRQTPQRKACAASWRAVADYCQERKLVDVL